jgi:hypothetical protein
MRNLKKIGASFFLLLLSGLGFTQISPEDSVDKK